MSVANTLILYFTDQYVVNPSERHLSAMKDRPLVDQEINTSNEGEENTVKTEAYIPGLNDSAYAAEFSLRPVQRVNSRKVCVNHAVFFLRLFLRKVRVF